MKTPAKDVLKATKVFESCETIEQYRVAKKFASLVEKRHEIYMDMDLFYVKIRTKSKIKMTR